MAGENRSKSKIKLPRFAQYLLKLGLSVFAIAFITRMANSTDLWNALQTISWQSLVFGSVLYLVSQFASTIRLGVFFALQNIHVPLIDNFRLYLIGISYNLFLPGGIGGDAYKYVILKRDYQADNKSAFQALLLDRLCGLGAIGILLSLLSITWEWSSIDGYFFIPIAIALYGIAFWGCQRFFSGLIQGFHRGMALSFIVQLIQVGAVLVVSTQLGIDDSIAIAGIFFLSTLATAIPVFLGGIGARELVFASFASALMVETSSLVSIALVFSFFTIVSAIPGLFLDWFQKKKKVA